MQYVRQAYRVRYPRVTPTKGTHPPPFFAFPGLPALSPWQWRSSSGERLALESPASTSSPSRRTPASASSTDPTLDLTGSGVTCLVRDVLALLHTMMNVPRGQLYQYQA